VREMVRTPRHLAVFIAEPWLDGVEPDLVHDPLAATIDQAEKDGRVLQVVSHDDGDLAEIALTLHHLPETRALGLKLFERLMAHHVPGLEDRLNSLDRRPFH